MPDIYGDLPALAVNHTYDINAEIEKLVTSGGPITCISPMLKVQVGSKVAVQAFLFQPSTADTMVANSKGTLSREDIKWTTVVLLTVDAKSFLGASPQVIAEESGYSFLSTSLTSQFASINSFVFNTKSHLATSPSFARKNIYVMVTATSTSATVVGLQLDKFGAVEISHVFNSSQVTQSSLEPSLVLRDRKYAAGNALSPVVVLPFLKRGSLKLWVLDFSTKQQSYKAFPHSPGQRWPRSPMYRHPQDDSMLVALICNRTQTMGLSEDERKRNVRGIIFQDGKMKAAPTSSSVRTPGPLLGKTKGLPAFTFILPSPVTGMVYFLDWSNVGGVFQPRILMQAWNMYRTGGFLAPELLVLFDLTSDNSAASTGLWSGAVQSFGEASSLLSFSVDARNRGVYGLGKGPKGGAETDYFLFVFGESWERSSYDAYQKIRQKALDDSKPVPASLPLPSSEPGGTYKVDVIVNAVVARVLIILLIAHSFYTNRELFRQSVRLYKVQALANLRKAKRIVGMQAELEDIDNAWTAHTDDSGHVFYHNTITDELCFDTPLSLTEARLADAGVAQETSRYRSSTKSKIDSFVGDQATEMAELPVPKNRRSSARKSRLSKQERIDVKEHIKEIVSELGVVKKDQYLYMSSFFRFVNIKHNIVVLIEFFQMLAITFSTNIRWNQDYGVGQMQTASQFIALDTSMIYAVINDQWPTVQSQPFWDPRIFYYTLFAVMFLYWLISYWVKHSKVKLERGCRVTPCLFIVPVYMLRVISSILFLPILRIIFGILSCSQYQLEENSEYFVTVSDTSSFNGFCWELKVNTADEGWKTMGHFWYAVLALVTIFLFLRTAVFLQPLFQELNQVEAKYSSTFLLFLSTSKLVLAVATTFFPEDLYVEVAAKCIINAFICSYIAFVRPCRIRSVNNIRCALFGAALWASLCSVFYTSNDKTGFVSDQAAQTYPIFIMFGGWFIILCTCIKTTYLFDENLPKHRNKIKYFDPKAHIESKAVEDFETLGLVDKIRLAYQTMTENNAEKAKRREILRSSRFLNLHGGDEEEEEKMEDDDNSRNVNKPASRRVSSQTSQRTSTKLSTGNLRKLRANSKEDDGWHSSSSEDD